MASCMGLGGRETRRAIPARCAFTLTELLVVIGIIAIGLALFLPATRSARESARRSQCTNNLKQIGLGLQNYADVYKCFPAGAVWGDGTSSRDPAAPQAPYHYPWSVAILPFIEQKPIYDAINKRLPIMSEPENPKKFTGQYSTTVPPAYGSNGFNLLQAQQIPAFRCPTDSTFRGPGDMPMTMMWSNYAASEGVCYFPAKRAGEDSAGPLKSSAPYDHKGIFTFGEWTTLAGIRDGTARTIAVAEVTVGSVCNQLKPSQRGVTTQATPIVSYTGPIPTPPDWSINDAQNPPGIFLQGGTGIPRSTLTINSQPQTRAPMVFRALWVAVTNSVTGGAPCAGGDFFSGALGGPCGGADGFELMSTGANAAPLYGVAPTYNALYPPNSDWPGPDSSHPGAIIAVFADGHTQTILQDITYAVWASLNTRAGEGELSGEESPKTQ